MISGVAPLQLYQEEGIRAYTIGSGHQPVMGSYYLLKNALLTQPNIKTVVLEVTELFVQSNEPSYRKVFDYLPLTSVKWEGIQERIRWAELQDEEQGTDVAPSAAEYVLPILSYHDRWSELTYDDFTYPFQDTPYRSGPSPSWWTRGPGTPTSLWTPPARQRALSPKRRHCTSCGPSAHSVRSRAFPWCC